MNIIVLSLNSLLILDFVSSSERGEEDDGSTSLTPESAGLGGWEPKTATVKFFLYHPTFSNLLLTNLNL